MKDRERRARAAFEDGLRRFLAVAEPGTSGRITLHWGPSEEPVPTRVEVQVAASCKNL